MKTSPRLNAANILTAATRDPSVDAVRMGEISSLVAAGDLRGAQRVLTRNTRSTLAKAADTSSLTTVSTLTTEQRLTKLEHRLANVEQRLERLSPTAPMTNPGPTKPLNAQQLLAAIERYVTDPAQAGHLASLIQQGRLQEAARTLQLARRQHQLEEEQ